MPLAEPPPPRPNNDPPLMLKYDISEWESSATKNIFHLALEAEQRKVNKTPNRMAFAKIFVYAFWLLRCFQRAFVCHPKCGQ